MTKLTTQEQRLDYLVEAFKTDSVEYKDLRTNVDTESKQKLLRYWCPNARWYTGYDTIACVLLHICPEKTLIQGQSETGGCNLASACLAFFVLLAFQGLEQL